MQTSFLNILGLVYKENGKIVSNDPRPFLDMADLVLPAYDLVEINLYQDRMSCFIIETSRGCPFRCSFCYGLAFHQRTWREKKAQQSVDEIKQIIKRYGKKRFDPSGYLGSPSLFYFNIEHGNLID